MILKIIYVILALIFVAFLTGYILRKKVYKEVDRLEAWKIDMMNRPITEEISKVKGLTMSGETEEKFERWRQIWDEVLLVELPDIEEDFFDIEEAANKYRFKKAQQMVHETEEKLQQIEDKLAELLEDIQHFVSSEKQSRSEIGEVRELFLHVKKQFSSGRSSFRHAATWLEKNLALYDEKFAEFDEETSKGNYLNASSILEEIKKQLLVFSEYLEKLPTMYTELESGFPTDFRELKVGMKEMEDAGFSLEHFTFKEDIEKLEQECEQLIKALGEQQLEQVAARIDEIDKQIEGMYDALELEVKAKHEVETQLKHVEERLVSFHKKVDELLEEAKVVQQSYRLREEELSFHKKIHKLLTEHTKKLKIMNEATENQSQSYTMILKMMQEVNESLLEIEKEFANTEEKLATLRKDELKARETLSDLKSKLIGVKRRLQKSNIPGLPEGIIVEMEVAEEKLVKALEQLNEVPLEIEIINHLVEETLESINKVDERVEETIVKAHFAELLIQSGNRFRYRSEENSEQLATAEAAFRSFLYDDAIDLASAVVEQHDSEAIERLKEAALLHS